MPQEKKKSGHFMGATVLLFSFVLLAAGGAFWLLQGPDDPPARRVSGEAAPVEVPCAQEVPGRKLSCFRVGVRHEATGPLIGNVYVLRVEPRAGPSEPHPLLFLGGGPGLASVAMVSNRFAQGSPLSRFPGAIYFVDYRGTGKSSPELSCPKRSGTRASIEECFTRKRLNEGAPSFRTQALASDLNQVRIAFGIKSWLVYAVSFGTRVAMTLERDFPGTISRLVLDSPVPLDVDLLAQIGPNVAGALEAVIRACGQEPGCLSAHPKLGEKLERLLTQLDGAPFETKGYRVDGAGFVGLLLNWFYAEESARFVPWLIDEAAEGRFSALISLDQALSEKRYYLGAHLSVMCQDERPFTSERAIVEAEKPIRPALRGRVPSGRSYLDDCLPWAGHQSLPIENAPVALRVPTLILNAEWDPFTPGEYGRRIQRSAPSIRLLSFSGHAHGGGLSDCGFAWVEGFLSGARDPDCALAGGGKGPGFSRAGPSAQELERIQRVVMSRN